ncbi:hypothetical protein ACTXT7_004617 [Hymenolepis weldensis]
MAFVAWPALRSLSPLLPPIPQPPNEFSSGYNHWIPRFEITGMKKPMSDDSKAPIPCTFQKRMTKIENKEGLFLTLSELAKFADESAAVSDLEEKKEIITSMANIHSFMSQSSHSSISVPKIPYSTPSNSCTHQPTPNRNDNRRSSFNVPRLPASLTNKISILLKTILCYCLRGGRSNAATLGHLGVVNLLFKVLATVSGLSINYSGVSSASDETINRVAVVEKCTRNGLKMIANFSTIQQKEAHNLARQTEAHTPMRRVDQCGSQTND